MLVFRQLFDPTSSTYTYLLADAAQRGGADRPGVRAGPARPALLRELDLRLVATLDTHVHADHVTAAWLLKQRSGSAIALSAAAGANGADRRCARATASRSARAT
jgi:sulfur dioxygenase